MELTQAYLKSIIYYDPETGSFEWIVPPHGRHKSRQMAGGMVGGYLNIKVNTKRYPAHRLAFLYMDGAFPECQVDHINGLRTDNRWNNLRSVSVSDNAKNKRLQKNNKSGVTGVFRESGRKKWVSKIVVDKRHIKIGSYMEFHEAVEARKLAEMHYGFHENHGRLS